MKRNESRMQPRSHICIPGSVREWTHTLPNGLPLWELKALWSLESSKRYFKNQNSLDYKIPCTIGKLLKLKCLKWARMTHLSTSNTSYGQKKGRESKCQFDSHPLKVKNRPEIGVYKWRATYHWKALNKGYNFVLDFTLIKIQQKKLWASKVTGVPISGLPSLESENKMTFGCGPRDQAQRIL
jgi:hypothetical protein